MKYEGLSEYAREHTLKECAKYLYTRLYRLNWSVEKSFGSLLTDCSECNNISVV